jgi:hypothetical protein
MKKIVFAMIFISIFLLGCKSDSKEQKVVATSKSKISLEQGIIYTLERIRTWESFDCVVPSEESVQHWVSGDYNVMNCSSFAPYDGDEPEKAIGKFWEFCSSLKTKRNKKVPFGSIAKT